MLLLHGHYKFFPRRTAVRNAWCTVCKQSRLAVGIRSLVVIHLFYIPVLPIARVTDWTCTTCGKDVRANLTSRPGLLRWALVVAGLLIVAGLWVLIHALLTGEDALTAAGSRTAEGVASGATLMMIGGVWGWVSFRQHRRIQVQGFDDGTTAVAPLAGDRCPLCGDLVLIPGAPRCERCQVDIATR
ncbi:MAG: hypothetical protein ACO23N_00310 [Opitutales bacterium]